MWENRGLTNRAGGEPTSSFDEAELPPDQVLVLGADPGLSGVTAFGWEDLPEDLNVGDYNLVVANFESLPNTASGPFQQSLGRPIRGEAASSWPQDRDRDHRLQARRPKGTQNLAANSSRRHNGTRDEYH